ncbi:MAG: hypothetical protein M0Q40_12370 [Limnochordia bacterium]|nr:hypothetical protein [Limnochordia bacterium]
MFRRFHELWSRAGTYFFIGEGIADYLGELLHMHGLVWGFPYRRDPFNAPEITRFTLPNRILGITEANRGYDAMWQAFLLGKPFLDLPFGTLRFQRIYQDHPDVFFRGRFLDKLGLSYTSTALRPALHINDANDKLMLIVWNDGDPDSTHRMTINLARYPLLVHKDLSVIDVETGSAVPFTHEEDKLHLRVSLQSGRIGTICITAQ